MELQVRRRINTTVSTIGTFSIDGKKWCDSLEDADRMLESLGEKAKIKGETAIPKGKYQVKITWSMRFNKYTMQIMDVPYFLGIRIHSGNTAADTEGCILLGDATDEHMIIHSRVRVEEVFDLVELALSSGQEVTIEIK